MDRTSLLPRAGGDRGTAISGSSGGSGDGIGRSEILGLHRKQRNSILSIHLVSFAVDDNEEDLSVGRMVRELRGYGERDLERLRRSIPADRSSLVKIS